MAYPNPTPEVLAIAKINFEGNITPRTWKNHLKRDNGKVHFPAKEILSEVVYWYRPTIREVNGKIVYEKKFRGDRMSEFVKPKSDREKSAAKSKKTSKTKIEKQPEQPEQVEQKPDEIEWLDLDTWMQAFHGYPQVGDRAKTSECEFVINSRVAKGGKLTGVTDLSIEEVNAIIADGKKPPCIPVEQCLFGWVRSKPSHSAQDLLAVAGN